MNHLDTEDGHAQFRALREEVGARLLNTPEEGRGGGGGGSTEGDVGVGVDVDEVLMSVPGDVGIRENAEGFVKRTVERWGRLDVCVCNAGVCEFREFLE